MSGRRRPDTTRETFSQVERTALVRALMVAIEAEPVDLVIEPGERTRWRQLLDRLSQ